jgi:hypothetical protein
MQSDDEELSCNWQALQRLRRDKLIIQNFIPRQNSLCEGRWSSIVGLYDKQAQPTVRSHCKLRERTRTGSDAIRCSHVNIDVPFVAVDVLVLELAAVPVVAVDIAVLATELPLEAGVPLVAVGDGIVDPLDVITVETEAPIEEPIADC